jgi:D-alanine transaminase
MTLAYLNGNYQPLAETQISVMDRGFLFGDGVYEVIPVYARKPFRLHEHLQRLQNSLAATRMANPHSEPEWEAIIARLTESADSDDQQIYLQVTRGAAPVRNHAFPEGVVPTVFAMTDPLLPPAPELLIAGTAAVSASDIRWLRCNIKATSLLANCLLRQLAVDAGCAETVLFRDGILTEGAASNIFVVKDGMLLAPQKNHLMLPGITYDVILEICRQHDIPCTVRDITEAEVRNADELLMSSSTREVLPVVQLDGRTIGTGRPGPAAQRMAAYYQDFKRTVMYGQA